MHVFLNSAEESFLEKREASSTLKTMIYKGIPLKNLHNTHKETMCKKILLLTRWFSFETYMNFFKIAEYAYLE
jgi:hypothetical protein